MGLENINEILMDQGKNTIKSMKELNHLARKKGKERSDLYEKFRANEHSFRVYTYVNEELEQSTEIKTFLENLQLFGEHFIGVDTDFETTVDVKKAKEATKEVINSYNKMASKLGFEKEMI